MAILFSWQSVKAVQTSRIHQADVKRIEEKIQTSPAYACIMKATKAEWQRCAFATVTSETELSNCSLSSFDNPLYYYADEAQNICRLAYDINARKVDMQACLHFYHDEDQLIQERCFDKLISQLTSSDTVSICDQVYDGFYNKAYYREYMIFHLRCVKQLIDLNHQAGKSDQEISNTICTSVSNLDTEVADSLSKTELQRLCPIMVSNVKVVWPKDLFTKQSRVDISWDTTTETKGGIEIETNSYLGPVIINETEFKTHHTVSFAFDDRFTSSLFDYKISACTKSPENHCSIYKNRADWCSQTTYCK